MSTIYTVEGNTSGANGLVANGGGVAKKSYSSNSSYIHSIYRPKYKEGEALKVAQEALKYIGYAEKKSNSQLESFTANAGSGNYNMFAEHARKLTGSGVYVNGVAWCDIFADDIFIRALGVARAKELLYDWSAYTPTSASYLAKAGATKLSNNADAIYGDVIFFKNKSGICHIGIVITGATAAETKEPTSKDDAKITFIKGVQAACGAKVDGIAGSETLSKTVTVSTTRNSRHKVVRVIQTYLNYLGYNCGTVDGIAGAKFKAAVKSYQKANGCVADGVITARNKTWKKLLGMA